LFSARKLLKCIPGDARSITLALGGKWYGGYGLAFCPAHDDGKEPSLKIRADERKRDGIDVCCFGKCPWQTVKLELRRQGLLGEPDKFSRPRPQSQPRPESGNDEKRCNIEIALGLWRQSVPLPETLGWRYFIEQRGLYVGSLGDLSHALRWHGGVNAIVGLMTTPVGNLPCGVIGLFSTRTAPSASVGCLGGGESCDSLPTPT
jgi:hypothetical protein